MIGDTMSYFCPKCNQTFATLDEHRQAHDIMRLVPGNKDHPAYGPLTLPRYFAEMAKTMDELQSSVKSMYTTLSKRIDTVEEMFASYQGFMLTVPLSAKGVESAALENATCKLLLRGNTAVFDIKLEGSYRTTHSSTFHLDVLYPLPKLFSAVTSVVRFDLNVGDDKNIRRRGQDEMKGPISLEFKQESGKTSIYAVKDCSCLESWESGLSKCRISASGTLYFEMIPFTNAFDNVVIYVQAALGYLCYQNNEWCFVKDFTDPGCRLCISQRAGYCVIQNGANCLGYNHDEEEVKKYSAQNEKVQMKVVLVNPALGLSEISTRGMYFSALNGKPYFSKERSQCIIREI